MEARMRPRAATVHELSARGDLPGGRRWLGARAWRATDGVVMGESCLNIADVGVSTCAPRELI
jgi:hypothetical protein